MLGKRRGYESLQESKLQSPLSTTADDFTLESPGSLRIYLEGQRYLLSQRAREKLLSLHQGTAQSELDAVMKHYGVPLRKACPPAITLGTRTKFQIDRAKQFAYSELMRRSKLSLPDMIRLVRGETSHDPRPNKALTVPDHLPNWSTYKYKAEWREIVTRGSASMDHGFS